MRQADHRETQSCGRIQFRYHTPCLRVPRAPRRKTTARPQTLFDIFIEEGGATSLLELDLYLDRPTPRPAPKRFCAARMDACRSFTVKTKEMAGNEPVMAPIGEGNLDWDSLVPACEDAGVEWYAVEQDECRRDPFDCLKSSFNYLSTKLPPDGLGAMNEPYSDFR
jgi:hypothetical protein